MEENIDQYWHTFLGKELVRLKEILKFYQKRYGDEASLRVWHSLTMNLNVNLFLMVRNHPNFIDKALEQLPSVIREELNRPIVDVDDKK